MVTSEALAIGRREEPHARIDGPRFARFVSVTAFGDPIFMSSKKKFFVRLFPNDLTSKPPKRRAACEVHQRNIVVSNATEI